MSNSMKGLRVARGMSQFFFIVLLLLTCGVLSAQNQEHRIRNIVLVRAPGPMALLERRLRHSRQGRLQRQHRQEPETSFKKTSLPQGASLLNKMDRAFLSVIATGEP